MEMVQTQTQVRSTWTRQAGERGISQSQDLKTEDQRPEVQKSRSPEDQKTKRANWQIPDLIDRTSPSVSTHELPVPKFQTSKLQGHVDLGRFVFASPLGPCDHPNLRTFEHSNLQTSETLVSEHLRSSS